MGSWSLVIGNWRLANYQLPITNLQLPPLKGMGHYEVTLGRDPGESSL